MSTIDLRSIMIIGGQELRGTWRNRWFLLHALVFGGLAFLLSAMGLAALGRFGITGFGRTAASLLHLVMVLVPLMGLLMGAMSIAVEREHGRLAHGNVEVARLAVYHRLEQFVDQDCRHLEHLSH